MCPVCRRISSIRASALTRISGTRGGAGGFGSWALDRQVVAIDGTGAATRAVCLYGSGRRAGESRDVKERRRCQIY